MATFTWKTATVSSFESGPEQVVVVGETASGSPYDFDVHVPRGTAEGYLRGLGFGEYTLVAVVEKRDPRGRAKKIVETSTVRIGQPS